LDKHFAEAEAHVSLLEEEAGSPGGNDTFKHMYEDAKSNVDGLKTDLKDSGALVNLPGLSDGDRASREAPCREGV
jgi:hypothetical protein